MLGALNTCYVLEAVVRVVLARPEKTSDCPAPPGRTASTHLYTVDFHYQMSPTASTAKTQLCPRECCCSLSFTYKSGTKLQAGTVRSGKGSCA